MTAGYLVSLLHRCTIALGKKRHQSNSSARRQRRIISGEVFTAFLKKNGSHAKKNCILGKAQKSLFCGESSQPGFAMVPGQEPCRGARATPAHGLSEPGHPERPSARAGNQRGSVISLSFLSPPVKQTLCNQRHRPKTCISSRQPGGVRGCAEHSRAAGASHLPHARRWQRVSNTSVPQTSLLQGLQCPPPHEGPGFLLHTSSKRSEGKFVPGTGTCQRMNEHCMCPWAALKGCH